MKGMSSGRCGVDLAAFEDNPKQKTARENVSGLSFNACCRLR